MSYTHQWPQAGVAGGQRAGFWQRFVAALIDGLLVGAVSGVLTIAFKNGKYAAAVALGAAYFVYMEGGASGQTIGKRVMGIRVMDQHTGDPIGYVRAFVRYIGRIVSAVFIYIGYLWMLWDPEKQCWHDKFASDVVAPVAVYPPPAWR